MPRYISFLRAINVGKRTVTKDRFIEIYESMGFTGIETFINSGNVAFNSPVKDSEKLEAKIEKTLAAALGYEAEAFVRSAAEIAEIAAFQPFGDLKGEVPKTTTHAIFLKAPLPEETQKAVLALKSKIDDFVIRDTEVFWLCRTSTLDSPFAKVKLDRKPGKAVTARNMNTVHKIAARFAKAQLLKDRA